MSLVELMIALLIGLLLSAAIITVYMSNKTTFWETEAAASMQDNALFAKRLIKKDVTHARFSNGVGIGNISDDDLTLPNGQECGPEGVIKIANLPSIYAVAAVDAPACLANVKSGTDVLFIKRVGTEAPSPFQSNKIYFKPDTLYSGQLFLGSDGLTAINDAITDADYADAQSGEGSLREFIYRVYYIADLAGRVFPQLRRMSLRVNSGNLEWFVESVADGIEDIHFQFGIDKNRDGQVDTYVTATDVENVADWNEVNAVKMFMLIQSTRSDMGYTDEKTYNYRDTGATTVTGPYHRKLHQTTFMIPN